MSSSLPVAPNGSPANRVGSATALSRCAENTGPIKFRSPIAPNCTSRQTPSKLRPTPPRMRCGSSSNRSDASPACCDLLPPVLSHWTHVSPEPCQSRVTPPISSNSSQPNISSMIGTPHSERAARLMTYLAVASFALSGARADEVFLEGGKLTGTVTGIDASGSLVLQTPLATEPLGIRASAIRKIVISAPTDNSPEREDIAELSNGDKLPGDIKSYLNGSFEISTWYAGAIRLPRAAVSAVHFGLRKEHSILFGPGQLGDWQEHEGWTVEGNELVAKSAGMIRRAVNLPDSFRYRGRVSWAGQEPNQPNLQIFFAESPAADNRKSDCYILTFNYAGLELKRQNSQGKTWNSIRAFNMRPEDFPESEFY